MNPPPPHTIQLPLGAVLRKEIVDTPLNKMMTECAMYVRMYLYTWQGGGGGGGGDANFTKFTTWKRKVRYKRESLQRRLGLGRSL